MSLQLKVVSQKSNSMELYLCTRVLIYGNAYVHICTVPMWICMLASVWIMKTDKMTMHKRAGFIYE